MELLEGESLRRFVLERYSKNPKGWSFVISPSLKHGFFDAFVSGPDGTWMLKIDSLFKPLPVVLGSPTEADPRVNSPFGGSTFPYGYRKLPPELVLQMLGSESHPRDEDTTSGLLSFLGSEPVVPEEGSSYAEGPIVFTRTGRSGLSESQKKLDDRLTSEMRRLLKTRYPAYG